MVVVAVTPEGPPPEEGIILASKHETFIFAVVIGVKVPPALFISREPLLLFLRITIGFSGKESLFRVSV